MDRIVRTALQGGEGPDIVMTPGPAYANEYIDANLFAELDEYSEQYKWDDKLLSWALELGRYEVQLAEVGCGDRPQPSGAAALSPDFENFSNAWVQGNFATTMLNSTILTVGTIVGVCVIAGTAAYAMSRLDLPGTDAVLLYLFVASAIPFQIFLVPLFFLWSILQLTNTLFGLIVIYWAVFSPLATLLLRSYLVALPRDFEDAARIDGASEL
jgi:ABC-type glycerol-3-phosphate transport system permease component